MADGKFKPVLYADYFSPTRYAPSSLVQAPYPVKDLDFTSGGAYAVYNWELFFHAPLLIAMHLSKNQRFAEAQQWFHYIFDPTDDSDGPTPERFWKVRPFQYTHVQKIEEILVNLATNADPKLQYLNPLNGVMTFNAVAQQLQVVARMIDAAMRGAVAVKRQVFFVSLGGFDTHDLQNRNHADLMARVAQALRYFDTTLGALNARNLVTTFTASDFGRTFTSNGDGTDHGWGAHHFVMGGAVKGGDVYGRFPVLAPKNANNNNFDGSGDQLGNGALLPVHSVDQLAATLGAWFGVSAGDLAAIFPNLANFDAAQRNLGFMV